MSVVYPGSFDPLTCGHMDILKRGAALYDRIFVGVLNNAQKRHAFSLDERKSFVELACRAEGLQNVEVRAFDGLLVDFAQACGAQAILRGLRTPEDFTYEAQLCAANRHLAPELETVYLIAKPALAFLSSALVREIGSYNGTIDGLVPDAIKNTIAERLSKR
ncbi:MAG: pantetheine-phosphate adenylyltransferase [Clostridiaceae bacterium]|nr:pantetheine-phosphate adenylyltransferase [Eubacteriales bacterium]